MLNAIVLDSNLVVSAFLNPHSVAAQALAIGLENFSPVCSREIFAELVDVLALDKFDKYISKNARVALLDLYAQSVQFFDVPLAVTDCKDPKDNKFLALALAAQASVLVTGDKKDLLVMNPYQGVAIMGLREFVDGHARYLPHKNS